MNNNQATASKKTTVGIRKHREWKPGNRTVSLKYDDVNQVSFGCGKQGDTKEWTEFSIMVETEKNDIRLVLSRKEALRMIEHFTESINSEK